MLTEDSPLTRRISVCKNNFFYTPRHGDAFCRKFIKRKEVGQNAIPSLRSLRVRSVAPRKRRANRSSFLLRQTTVSVTRLRTFTFRKKTSLYVRTIANPSQNETKLILLLSVVIVLFLTIPVSRTKRNLIRILNRVAFFYNKKVELLQMM